MSQIPNEPFTASAKSIDEAISACDVHIRSHRSEANKILTILVVLLAGLFSLFYFLPRFSPSTSSAATNYVIFGLCVLVFGVLMAIYRFHLTEIAKGEHFQLGFLRIRIAANNIAEGFLSEVRRSLTESAFDYAKPSIAIGKTRKLESPLPGHPTSDIATFILNKVFEQVEVRAIAKSKVKDSEDAEE
jgi:hypothetical protein